MSEAVVFLANLAEQGTDKTSAINAGIALLITGGAIALGAAYRWAVRKFHRNEKTASTWTPPETQASPMNVSPIPPEGYLTYQPPRKD